MEIRRTTLCTPHISVYVNCLRDANARKMSVSSPWFSQLARPPLRVTYPATETIAMLAGLPLLPRVHKDPKYNLSKVRLILLLQSGDLAKLCGSISVSHTSIDTHQSHTYAGLRVRYASIANCFVYALLGFARCRTCGNSTPRVEQVVA